MPGRGPKKRGLQSDVSEHLHSLADLLAEEASHQPEGDWLPTPRDPQKLFDLPAPIELEVGCGKGLFLASAAAANPAHNYLGVELAPGYAQLTAARCAGRGLSNARVVSGDATLMLRSVLGDSTVHAVHVYFPDPWWKARHRKRRVLCEPFFEQASRILIPTGTVHVWTDVEEYFDEAMQAAAATGLFLSPREVTERVAENEFDYRTHFERRTRLAKQPVWRAELDRSDRVPPSRQPITMFERIRLQTGDADPPTN